MDVSGNVVAPSTDAIQNLFQTLFTSSNLALVLWFLAIYFVAYFVMKFFFSKNENAGSGGPSALGRILDVLFLGGLLVYLILTYFNETDKSVFFKQLYSQFTTYVDQPSSFFTTLLGVLLFYIVVYLFQLPMSESGKPISVYLIETFLWLLFIAILFVDFFKYVLGISITDTLSKIRLFGSPPSVSIDASGHLIDASGHLIDASGHLIDTSGNQISKSVNALVDASSCAANVGNPTDEVFNISNNVYSYSDAQSVCKMYGAKLATYDQIEKAYQNGGEWCNYGWSEGQMAYFPTQKSTWAKLQATDNHKNDCGRPGVNGGYIANPYIQFGVNCYGQKPKPTADDLAKMNARQNTAYPQTAADIELQTKIDQWKNTVSLNSYNNNKWSQY
jgi:Extracellular link domain